MYGGGELVSKKDYQAIARAIYQTWEDTPDSDETMGLLINRLSEIFAADNPRFNRQRFIEACETGTTKGMPKRA